MSFAVFFRSVWALPVLAVLVGACPCISKGATFIVANANDSGSGSFRQAIMDANAFDEKGQLAFSSTGEGIVTIAHEDAPDKLTVVQSLKTEPGAKTMTLDPTTHKIYLGAAKYEAPGEKSSGGGKKRPSIVPGSFKVLVYSP